ncbi:YhcN/YlaJ family sporulation lipoprotein [Paenibacillus taichungensis]|uniref:YhcN/YlaJ family sporulation lipoprotein n=1 Tax=Paenibacillus taichungensis TaxID=484184 RepID=UPI002DB89BE2|nr:YhcN/YlaJ family sporulation lipoprotein [Paenibacillus taichungensis]MEC0109327.1 YhcN/YlaJ family sporulation lipoprotein [Paenibacillus taichungensis]MEC0196463.1 YhcN/YlaJ family sporulation lipoprotein [Paenibacillus taichungensis]
MPAAKKATAISLSLSTAIFVMAGLTGCGTSTKDNNLHTQSVRHEVKGINRYGVESNGMDGIRAKSYRTHNVTDLKSSDELAKRISEMKEVKSASVMLTDRNAYVAVRLTDGHTGKLESKSLRNRANGTMRTESMGQDMGGLRVNGGNGTMSPYSTSGIAPGLNTDAATDRSHMGNDRSIYGTMGTGSYGMMRGLTNSGNARTITEGPRTMSEGRYGMKSETSRIDSTDDNTSEEIKSKISAKIKQFAPHVENVYVSANPDFVQHVESYATDIRNGKPVSGMINTFQSMVERIFPTNALNTNHRDGVLDDGIMNRNNKNGMMNRMNR